MPSLSPPQIPPGELSRSSALALSRYLAETARTLNIFGAWPIKVEYGSSCVQLSIDSDDLFIAKITSGTSPYAWVEQLHDGGTAFADKDGGRTGTTTVNPAYDSNGSITIAANTIGLMARGKVDAALGQEYVFFGGGSGGSSGLTTTVNYLKSDCLIGTLTFTNGSLTGST